MTLHCARELAWSDQHAQMAALHSSTLSNCARARAGERAGARAVSKAGSGGAGARTLVHTRPPCVGCAAAEHPATGQQHAGAPQQNGETGPGTSKYAPCAPTLRTPHRVPKHPHPHHAFLHTTAQRCGSRLTGCVAVASQRQGAHTRRHSNDQCRNHRRPPTHTPPRATAASAGTVQTGACRCVHPRCRATHAPPHTPALPPPPTDHTTQQHAA